jgi:ABC-2 type transport system permease protein
VSIRLSAVSAVFKRNFHAFFGNPTGYVFITLFIVATAYQAFSTDRFFASNMADLSALNAVFLWLPVVFIPAITMSTWAEERKLGTDELLLTLPVRDIEVVLGKYLAALAVYTVSLVFALSHVLVLMWLAEPDAGLLLANYLGYWMVGVALIPLGMAASALTVNVTVAFIVGTAFCLCAVFAGDVVVLTLGVDNRLVAAVGMEEHFRNFTLGAIALADVLYFAAISVGMLYLNMLLLSRRHWAGGARGWRMEWHYSTRIIALAVAAASLVVLCTRRMSTVRADTTAGRLNSVSSETVRLVRQLPGDRPVYVQAYISPVVPDEHVAVRRDLLRMLRQMEALGGGRILVNIHGTELYSDEAKEAADRFEITPERVGEMVEGRHGSTEIFMGVAMTCGPEQQVIPFMSRGLPVEYELVRSLRTVTKAERRKIGILRTDAKLLGGLDFQTYSQRPDWEIVTELKKQYTVVEVSPDEQIPADIDVLIVALPSSLNQAQMDVLSAYISASRPALLLMDPFPVEFPHLAASQPRMPSRGGYGQPPQEPKGDLNSLLADLGFSWQSDMIVWDLHNPITRLRDLPPEVVFVGHGSGASQPFAKTDLATRDMSRIVMLFAGAIRQLPGGRHKVTNLMTTGMQSGSVSWQDLRWGGEPQRAATGVQYVLAVRVGEALPTRLGEDEQEPVAAANVIAVADLDVVGNQFFQLRRQGLEDLRFDNVTFILNCVDKLAGDESLIELRNRRPEYRTLTSIETRRTQFQKRMLEQEEQAEQEAKEELDEARKALNEKVDEIKAREGLDARSKDILVQQVESIENRKFETKKASIEAKRDAQIAAARKEMYSSIRLIENRVRFLAVVLPPLPAILIGLVVFAYQRMREKLSAPLTRAMRKIQ